MRSASAVSAGLLREIGEVTLPDPVRETKLYRNMVEATLRFLIEQVGEVEGAYPAEGKLSEDFALRTGEVFAGPLLDHYSQTLSEIREVGFLAYWRTQFRPYLRAAASQFSREHASLTERFLERRSKG